MNDQPNRRDLLGGVGALALTLAARPAFAGDKKADKKSGDTKPTTTTPVAAPVSTFAPAPLPYAEDALAPVLSAETLSFHYGKHHKAYADKLTELVAGTELAGKSLTEIIQGVSGTDKPAIFNNAAQVYNHDFYWQSLKPGGGGAPTGTIADAINGSFGSFDEFKKVFHQACMTQFGSGWAWVVLEADKLKVVKTANADTPLTNPAQRPILVIDVWEHAYYVDYRNKRADYATAIIEKLIDWDRASARLKA